MAGRWGLELSKEEAQNRMDGILDECIGGLEMYLWGNGAKIIPFPPNLINLTEKLGFNVDRFLKIE
jgi:hypothetical protein